MNTCTLPPTNKYPCSRTWQVPALWELSSKLPTQEISVDYLWNLYKDRYCWALDGEEITNEHFYHHFGRILNADLTNPIIISEEDYIMDGVHRLLKARHLNLTHINAKKFEIDP